MAVTLKTLIEVSPFTKEDKEKLLGRLETLNEDQKLKIAQTCWKILALKYYSKIKIMIDEVLAEVREGKRKYNLNDITEIEANVTHEFADLLRHAETNEQIDEVRRELEKFMPQQSTNKFNSS